MRTRKVIALSLLSTGALVLFSGCPAQPPGPCVVARTGASVLQGTDPGANYIVQYYFTAEASTGSNCANAVATDPTGIGAWPTGNFVGGIYADAFGAVTDINKVTGLVPEEFGWTNTYTGDYVQGSPNSNPPVTNNPIALGHFTTDTFDANSVCTITPTSPGVQVINGVTVTYQFTSVLMYAAAIAGEGTQMQAQVSITRTSAAGGTCIRNYTAIGLWPSVLCNIDNDCNPLPQPGANPPRPIGSGLLTGIPVACNLSLVANDPIKVPAADLAVVACGDGTDQPWLEQTNGCGGGAKNNNGISVNPNPPSQTGLCFYSSPSPTKFPYLQ